MLIATTAVASRTRTSVKKPSIKAKVIAKAAVRKLAKRKGGPVDRKLTRINNAEARLARYLRRSPEAQGIRKSLRVGDALRIDSRHLLLKRRIGLKTELVILKHYAEGLYVDVKPALADFRPLIQTASASHSHGRLAATVLPKNHIYPHPAAKKRMDEVIAGGFSATDR